MNRRMIQQDQTCDTTGVYEIEVTSGGDKFSPVTYNSFESPRVVVRVRALSKDDTPDAMFKRAYSIAEGYARNTFETAMNEHIERCARAADAARDFASKLKGR